MQNGELQTESTQAAQSSILSYLWPTKTDVQGKSVVIRNDERSKKPSDTNLTNDKTKVESTQAVQGNILSYLWPIKTNVQDKSVEVENNDSTLLPHQSIITDSNDVSSSQDTALDASEKDQEIEVSEFVLLGAGEEIKQLKIQLAQADQEKKEAQTEIERLKAELKSSHEALEKQMRYADATSETINNQTNTIGKLEEKQKETEDKLAELSKTSDEAAKKAAVDIENLTSLRANALAEQERLNKELQVAQDIARTNEAKLQASNQAKDDLLAQADKEKGEAQTEIERVATENKELQNALDRVTREKANLESDLKIASAKAQNGEEVRKDLEGQLGQLTRTRENLEIQLQSQQQKEELEELITGKQKEVSTLNKYIGVAEEKHEAENKAHEQVNYELQTALDDVRKTAKKTREERDTYESSHKTLQAEVDGLKAQNERLEKTNQALLLEKKLFNETIANNEKSYKKTLRAKEASHNEAIRRINVHTQTDILQERAKNKYPLEEEYKIRPLPTSLGLPSEEELKRFQNGAASAESKKMLIILLTLGLAQIYYICKEVYENYSKSKKEKTKNGTNERVNVSEQISSHATLNQNSESQSSSTPPLTAPQEIIREDIEPEITEYEGAIFSRRHSFSEKAGLSQPNTKKNAVSPPPTQASTTWYAYLKSWLPGASAKSVSEPVKQ